MSLHKRESIVPNVETLPKDDVVDLYGKLAELYSSTKLELDGCRQELHQQKIQTKTLLSSQNDLQNELDSVSSVHIAELNDYKRKSNALIDDLKGKNRELVTERTQLESAVEELSKKLVDAQKQSDDLQFELSKRKPAPRYSDGSNLLLETQVEELKLIVSEMNGGIRGKSEVIKAQRSQLEELKEKLMCVEDNLSSKRSEVDEKNDAIEVLQEQIQVAMNEIATLRSSPDEASKFRRSH